MPTYVQEKSMTLEDKTTAHIRITELEDKIKKLEDALHTDDQSFDTMHLRIKKLEEKVYNRDFSVGNTDFRVIDKKVWEEIKSISESLNHYRSSKNADFVYALLNAIKKVDPDY